MPCVVGTRMASKVLRDGELVTIDGAQDMIYEGERPAATARSGTSRHRRRPGGIGSGDRGDRHPGVREPGNRRKSRAGRRLLVDGVGLLRAECMISDALGGVHPKQLLALGRGGEFIDRMSASL